MKSVYGLDLPSAGLDTERMHSKVRWVKRESSEPSGRPLQEETSIG